MSLTPFSGNIFVSKFNHEWYAAPPVVPPTVREDIPVKVVDIDGDIKSSLEEIKYRAEQDRIAKSANAYKVCLLLLSINFLCLKLPIKIAHGYIKKPSFAKLSTINFFFFLGKSKRKDQGPERSLSESVKQK